MYICIYVCIYICVYIYVFYNYTHIDNIWDEAVNLQHTALSCVCDQCIPIPFDVQDHPGGLKVHVLSNKCEESKDLLFGPLSRGAAALRGWGPNFWGIWLAKPYALPWKNPSLLVASHFCIFWLLVFFWASALAIIRREIPLCWTHTDTNIY